MFRAHATLLFAFGLALEVASGGQGACVWRIDGPASSLYIAGSVHMLRAEDLPYPAAFDTAYQDSSRIFFEAYVDTLESPGAQEQIARIGRLPRHETLREHLTFYTYSRVENYLKRQRASTYNPSYDALLSRHDCFKSKSVGMLAMTLSTLEAENQGVFPDYGIEILIAGLAHEDSKPMFGLESPFYQMRLLNTLSRSEGDRLMRITLKNCEHSDWYFPALINSWKSGDMALLEAIIVNDYPPAESLTRKLLLQRNQNWLPTLEAALHTNQGNSLVIVGAAHVLGEGSLIELFRSRGYRVTQLP